MQPYHQHVTDSCLSTAKDWWVNGDIWCNLEFAEEDEDLEIVIEDDDLEIVEEDEDIEIVIEDGDLEIAVEDEDLEIVMRPWLFFEVYRHHKIVLESCQIALACSNAERIYTENNDYHDLNVFTEDIDLFIEGPQDNETPPAEVHNLVGTCRIWRGVLPLDLQHVSMLLPNAHYDKQNLLRLLCVCISPSAQCSCLPQASWSSQGQKHL